MVKIKNYTESEINYILKNFSTMTVKELAEKLQKSSNSILYVIRTLGLNKQLHSKWTDEDIDFLKNNYMSMLVSDMAKHLNKTINSVNSKLSAYNLTKTKEWTKSEIEYLKENYLMKEYFEIGKILNRSEGSVRAKCFDLGFKKKEDSWTEEEDQYIKNNYYELSFKEMAQVLHRSDNAIRLRGSRMGLKKYPYTCNYHYFDIIDTEEKAYWLGFLTADGWINKNDKTNAGVVGVELQYKDIGHLKKFNKSVNGNYKITDRYKECSVSPYSKRHHTCILRFFSKTMYDSLEKQGFTNDKTFNASIPKFDKKFIRDYLRGYFDGDGCLCYTKKSFHVNFITASLNLMSDIKNILDKLNFCCYDDFYINKYDTKMYTINIYKTEDKIKFLDYIYKNSSVYLDRKYQKYLKIKQDYT